MQLSSLLILALPLLHLPVLAAPNAEPVPGIDCSGKRDNLWPALQALKTLEKRSCGYKSCDDCYNRQLSCVNCNHPHGCTQDNPVACTAWYVNSFAAFLSKKKIDVRYLVSFIAIKTAVNSRLLLEI